MRLLLTSLLLASLSMTAAAETTLIATEKLPSKEVYDVAQLTPLVVTSEGTPAVVLLDLDKGDVVPPHAAKSGLRLLTVLSGELSWGDGSAIDVEKETVYPAGSLLTIPSGVDHWLAARSGALRVQLVVLVDEKPVPAILEQMK